MSTTRRHWLQIRVTKDEHAAVKAAAEKAGKSLSDYGREKLLPPKQSGKS